MKLGKLISCLITGLLLTLSTSAIVSAATAATTISSEISAVISVSTNGTVNVNVTPTGSGAQTIASDTVTVSTNNPAGYTLQLEDTSGSTALNSGSNNINASSGTQASPAIMAANTWGYRVDSIGGFGAGPTSSAANQAIGSLTFAGVPSSGAPNTIKTTSSVAANDTIQVWYGVAANTLQPAGTYTNSVTYTATTN